MRRLERNKSKGGGIPPLFFKTIVFAIFAVPISSVIKIQPADFWFVQYLALISFFVIMAGLVVWETSSALGLLVFLSLFSFIIVANQSPRALMCLFQITSGCLIIHLLSFMNKQQRMFHVKSILGFAFLQGLFLIVQLFHKDPFFKSLEDFTKSVPVGWMGSFNQIGLFSAVTAPFSFIFCPGILIVNLLGLICSKTTTCWISFAVIAAFFFRRIKTRLKVLLLLLSLVGAIFFYMHVERITFRAFRERFVIVKHSINDVIDGKIWMEMKDENIKKLVTCNPLFGYGLGNFMVISPRTQSDYLGADMINRDGTIGKKGHRYAHAHNDPVEFFYEFGYLGLAWMIYAGNEVIGRFRRARKTKILMASSLALLAQFICSLGIFTVHTALGGFFLILFLGLFYGEVRDGTQAGVV